MTATEEFHRLAGRVIDDALAADPVSATWLGDHRFDDRLPEWSADSVDAQLRLIDQHLTELDAVDDIALDVPDLVDLEILRAGLTRSRFELGELRSLTWNPMEWNPGTALYLLVSRDFAPAPERRASLLGRMDGLGGHFASARAQLEEMPAIHVETAVAQLAGTHSLVDGEVRALADDDRAVDRALREIADFGQWLQDRLVEAHRSPRLGERLYAGALWHGLDDDASVGPVLTDARSHLDEVTARMREAAAEYLGVGTADDDAVRAALADVARSAPVSDESVLRLMRESLDRTTAFVRQHDLVSIPEVDVRVIEMPEIHRGVAVAYCDAPGPLESASVPTYVAVAPTPLGWSPERVASFYREYNGVQLHDLAIHEAMPGHVLQLAHAQRLESPTAIRRFGRSGVFIEGWAVYAEEVMVDRGYTPHDGSRAHAALRLQQLKMQARGAINAILDIEVHSGGMAEEEGLALMRDRGFQEEGESIGKWRRALLTAGQLPTYFVGYRGVSGIANDLRVLHPDWSDRQLHDLMLAHGSPAPRHLRTLLGI